MASPGIRAYQIAGALGRAIPEAEITLAIPGNHGEIQPPAANVELTTWSTNEEAMSLARQHEVAISRNFPPHFARLLGETRLAVDAFTPFYTEWMELSRGMLTPTWQRMWMSANRWYLNMQFTLADFIFCADERQRDMSIGMLMALALVPPDVYQRDPSLRRLIDVVPYGVPSTPMDPQGPVLRGVVPGIEPGDEILLWNGSIVDWNDTATAIRAMDVLKDRRPQAKLVFMGLDHPDLVVSPGSRGTVEAVGLARELGLEGRNVFFLSGWVPYERIDDYLAEANASICLGYERLESRFAFRTRFVDLFRAQVPLICTQGDVLAERVAKDPLGITVPERDVPAVVAAIEKLLDDRGFAETARGNMATISRELAWDVAVQPLARFCAGGESYAMPAHRRRRMSYTRGAMYVGLKKVCMTQAIQWI